jgi:hypothetical protein
MLVATFAASAASASGSTVPGTTGTPASRMRRRALVLSPMASIAEAGGPRKMSPAFCTASANSARSERKP